MRSIESPKYRPAGDHLTVRVSPTSPPTVIGGGQTGYVRMERG